jgi:UDP-N-acetylmuramoyl-L-alanyl-D-glutamate--2,6-diaminopimelate ligase
LQSRSRLWLKGSVHKIEFDSRKIEVNDVFVAIRVLFQTGMIIFKKAIELGQ